MAVTLSNTCDDGADGTTVSTSNSNGPNQFDAISITGTGNTLTFDSTHVHSGTQSIKSAIGATAGVTYFQWTATSLTPGSPFTTLYSRVYLWIDAAPGTNTRVCAFIGATLLRASLQLTTGRIIRTVNSAGSAIGTSTTVIPTGQWVRLEYDVTGDATAGVLTCRIYLNADSTTPDETLSNTAVNTGGTIDTWRICQSSSVTSSTYWLDDVTVTDQGPVGPTSSPAPNVGAFPATVHPGLGPMGLGRFNQIRARKYGYRFEQNTPATEALGVGTASDANLIVAPNPNAASGTGLASDANTGIGVPSSAATGTGLANDASTSIQVNAGAALGTGTAGNVGLLTPGIPDRGITPVVLYPGRGPGSPSRFRASRAGFIAYTNTAATEALGTGAASDATVGLVANPSAATGSGAVGAANTTVTGNASAATVTGTAYDATVTTATSAPAGLGTTSRLLYPGRGPNAPSRFRQRAMSTDRGHLVIVVADMQPGSGVNPPPAVVAALVRAEPQAEALILPGDLANDGTTAQYGFFDTMYGVFKTAGTMYPVPGNHDWVPGNLTQYDTYFGATGHPTGHYYSFDLFGWHCIAVESDSQVPHDVTSAQYAFIKADLDANIGKPTLAFWHHPRWSDGNVGSTGDDTTMTDIWNLLYSYRVDLVFSGHCHSYQRFPKWNTAGQADPIGIREFVVGSGGSGLHTLSATQRSDFNSYQVAAYDQLNSQWFGYLRLWLTPNTYSWEFQSQNAGVLDAGGPILINGQIPTIGSGSATGAANDATVNVTQSPTAALTQNARHPGRGPSTFRFTQRAPAFSLGETDASSGLASGTALDAQVLVTATAGFGAATGSASDAAVSVSSNAGSTATGIAYDAGDTIAGNAGTATGSGAVNAGVANIQPAPTAATATGTAFDASVTVNLIVGSKANARHPGKGPSAARFVQRAPAFSIGETDAGTALAAGTAFDASVAAAPAAALATAAANQAMVSLAIVSGSAAGSGSAPDAMTGFNTTVFAGAAIAVARPNGLWTARPRTTISIWPPGNRGITPDPG